MSATEEPKATRKVFLSTKHRNELHQESAIDPAVTEARGYETIDRPTAGDSRSRERLERLKFPDWATDTNGRYPGLLIPQYSPTGERNSYQYKPPSAVTVDGKFRKYASPLHTPPKVDVHPFNRFKMHEVDEELWISEGIKKGDSLTSRGVCVVTLTGVYNWRNRLATLGDWEDVLIKGRTVTINFDADALTNHNVLNAMKRLAAWLRHKGATKVWYLITPSEIKGVKVKGADDYFAAGGTLEDLKGHRTTVAPVVLNASDTYTDAKLADVIADEVLVDSFHYVPGVGWQKYSGGIWKDCTDLTVGDAVRTYSLRRFNEAHAAMQGPNGDPAAVTGWLGMLSASKERAVLGLAKGVRGIEVDINDLDADPDVLCVPNGVVDLVSGELHPHDPHWLMTKMAGAPYLPGYEHPDWKQALQAIEEDVQEYYQIRMGQALTGHMTPDDKLIVCQGGGSNGKSTINIATARAAGTYYLLASDRILLANPDQHPTELMDLKGVRYAVAEETPEARRLAANRLKKTIGTPEITARHVHKDSVTFKATHSFFLSTNYRPMVEETDNGTWRRLELVSFPYTFRRTQKECTGPYDVLGDTHLRARCESDPDVHTAVLAWMVAGAVLWYEARRIMPEVPWMVEHDTRNWRKESDQVLCYIEDRVVFSPRHNIATQDLLTDLNEWLKDRGHRPWSDKTLASRFGDHDEVIQHRVSSGRVRLDEWTSRPVEERDYFDPNPYRFEDPRPTNKKLPERFRAWEGVRFRVAADDRDQAD